MQNSLIKHISSIHGSENPFKCRKCESSFDTKQNLSRHLASAHDGKINSGARSARDFMFKEEV